MKIGDKVRVIGNSDKRLKSYVGKTGKIAGGLTAFSCRVKLAYDDEFWFDLRDLELVDSAPATESPVVKKTTRRRKT